MSLAETLELIAGIALFVAAIWLYRKRSRDDARRGSQGAVLLLAVAAIMIIHALGGLEVTGLGMRG